MQTRRTRTHSTRALGAVACVGLLLASCGDDDDDDASDTSTAPSVTAARSTAAPATTSAPRTSTATTQSDTTTQSTADNGEPPIDVPVGVVFSAGATFGAIEQPGAIGALMAIDEINETGGFVIDGQTYVLQAHEVDATDTPAQAVAAVQTLIDEHDPIAVFGPTVSALAVPIVALTNREEIIEFSASTALGALVGTPEAALVIKTKSAEALTAQLHFDAVFDAYPEITSAVITADDTASGQAAGEVYLADIEARNIPVELIYHPTDITDMQPIITRLSADPPDLLVATGAAQTPINDVLDRAQDADMGIVHFAQCGYRSHRQFTADDIPFVCFSTPADLEYTSDPEVLDFVERLETFQDTEVDGQSYWSLTQYPYVYALVAAMVEAGTVEDTKAIHDALIGYTTPDDSVIEFEIDDNGEVIAQLDVAIVRGTDEVEVVTVKPS